MATPRSKKRKRKVLVATIILLALGGLTAVAILRKHEPVTRVETEKVSRRDITEKVIANGRIQPVLQVKISAEVSGEIIELPVKEGDPVQKGDLLVKIKPDLYVANVRSAEAGYKSALSSRALAEANLEKARLEFERNQSLFEDNLISESVMLEYKTAYDIARAQHQSSIHQVEVAQASLDRAHEELAKTTIDSPLTGTVSKLNSELGERVVGTAMMSGTEIMTVADLNEMEALVDIGEMDVVLVNLDQCAQLEVDAFRDRKFKGTVTEIANSSKFAPGGGQSQEAVKFEVTVRIDEQEAFRPGMSVTSEIETRYRTNVLAVPIQCVTTRPPKSKPSEEKKTENGTAAAASEEATNTVATSETNATPDSAADTQVKDDKAEGENARKPGEPPKPIEVVFVVEEERTKLVPVKRGISDDSYTEIVEGLEEGQEVVTGGYKAINRELEDGRKIRRGLGAKDKEEAEATAGGH